MQKLDQKVESVDACKTPIGDTHKNRNSLLASLEEKGKKSQSAIKKRTTDTFEDEADSVVAAAASERLSLSCDLIATLTEAEMEVIDCYANKLSSLGHGEVDQDEAYALAMVGSCYSTLLLYPLHMLSPW